MTSQNVNLTALQPVLPAGMIVRQEDSIFVMTQTVVFIIKQVTYQHARECHISQRLCQSLNQCLVTIGQWMIMITLDKRFCEILDYYQVSNSETEWRQGKIK